MGEAAYSFEWYRADKRIQKMVILLILRAQRESQVKVPFIIVDAATFLNVSEYFFSFFFLFLHISLYINQLIFILDCQFNCILYHHIKIIFVKIYFFKRWQNKITQKKQKNHNV